jgi:tetratricopeptide (TPR) repeat protein
VVITRIDRLSVEEQLTLKVATVIGRRFGLDELCSVHPIADAREAIPSQIEAMIRLRLLRADDHDEYRFRHAIIQDTCYALLPYSQRCDLHRRVAEHLEQSPGGDAPALYPALAHHWQRADVPDRAVEYLARAGEQALLRHYANGEAVHFFEELLKLDARFTQERDASERARWERELGEALFNLGRHAEGMPHFERALHLLGEKLPQSRRGTAIRVLTGGIARLLLRPRTSSGQRRSARDGSRWLEATRAHERLSTAGYTTGDTLLSIYTLMRAMRLGERTGPSPELARVYANFSNVLQLAGSDRKGDLYSDLALETARKSGDLAAQAHVLNRANLHRIVRGRWEVVAAIDESIALSGQIGNDYQWEESSSMRANTELLRGNFERSRERFAEILKRARRSSSVVHQLWALTGRADASLRLGALEDAIELAEQALELLDRSGSVDQVTPFHAAGVLTGAWLRRESRERSGPWAERTVGAMTLAARLGYGALAGFVGILEHHLPEPDAGEPSRDDLRTAARVCRWFRFTARSRPILRPAALRCEGRRAWHLGARRRAVARLRASAAAAESLGLPYERARAQVDLARYLNVDDVERAALFAGARRTFAELGAQWDLERVPAVQAE